MTDPTDDHRAIDQQSEYGLAGDTADQTPGSLDSMLDRHPDLWWLRGNTKSLAQTSVDGIRCAFSPDYHANRYQRNLYRVSSEHGHRFRALSAERVLELPDALFAGRRAPVFHQHWLKEIFSGRQADAAGLHWIDDYFNSLRRFQSRGGKVLWTVHNLFDHDLSPGEAELNLHCLKQMAGLADVILVHASDAATELQQIVGIDIADRVELLRHPLYDSMLAYPRFLPIEWRARKPRLPGLKFLMFGLIRPYKGAADLLRAFKGLAEAGELPESSLIIAGRVYDPELKGLVDQLGELNRRVLIIDRRLSDTELASACREADVGVLPYRKILTSGSYYQALTFGLPCVVPEVGMFRSEVEDGVTGITYSGSDGLTQALQRAYAMGRSQLAAMGERALGQCSTQTEREISHRFGRLLESVAGLPERPEVKLSFCIPVMNRLDDLKATLASNLQDNRESKGRVEFIVVSFDPDDSVQQWIEQNFGSELEEGYLRFHRAAALEFWHFGKAKNAFKNLMRGRIYASLDGDNFTGYKGGEHIIEVFERHDYKCVFHQFQGEWGDGTCGRVSLSREDYLDYGYDERFLPRQWDEMDAMLSVLVQRPDRTYVCYRGRSIIDISHPFRRFLDEQDCFPPTSELDPEQDPLFGSVGNQSVGKHDNRYVEDNAILSSSSVFNHLQSFFKNSRRDDLTTQYVSELVEIQRKLIAVLAPDVLERWVLAPGTAQPVKSSKSDIFLLACVRSEAALNDWYEYYKRLGVTRFLIVDDDSETPVEEILPYPDVHVWRPIVGAYRHAKAFWLDVLLARYCQDSWCLTVDADEFVSLPHFAGHQEPRESDLRRCVAVAEDAGKEYYCGFLLDMICTPDSLSSAAGDKRQYSHYQFVSDAPGADYSSHNTVRWSYGDLADWAFRIDVRYRINNSLDSLRKFPLFRYRREMRLNQGFHDLLIDGEKRSPRELDRCDLIPIKHYKLWSMSRPDNPRFAEGFNAYHHETRENLRALTHGIGKKILAAASQPEIYPYLGYELIPTPACQSIELRPGAADQAASDRDIMQRSAPILLEDIGDDVGLTGRTFSAPTMQGLIDWFCENTPYCRVLERSDDRVVLSAASDGATSSASARPVHVSKRSSNENRSD